MISSRFGFVALLLIIVLVTGTVGYYNIEGYSALDSLYMTVITVSTVGFQEVYPLSAEGKIFTMVLILGGVGIVVFAVGMFSEWLVNNATRMNQVIMKKQADSERMKEEFLDSLDLFETLENKDLRLALAKTPKNKEFSNMRKIDILEKFGLIVMAVEKKNNRFQVQVPFNKKIGAGTKVIVLGTDLQLKIFEKSEKRS